MNCIEFQNALEVSVDSRQLAGSAELCEHAQNCVECRVLWDEFWLLKAAIADWKPQTITVDLTDRVLAAMATPRACEELSGIGFQPVNFAGKHDRLEAYPTKSSLALRDFGASASTPVTTLAILGREARPAPRRSAWPLVTTIALVLLAVAVVLRDRPAEHEVVKAKPDSDRQLAVAHPTESVADLSDLVSDAQTAWRGLADSTVRRARELQVFVPSIRAAAEMEAGSPRETETEMEQTDDSIAPVPTEFRRAFEFFFNAA